MTIAMATAFEIPWTLNDENEFSLPVLPWYFTNQELGVAILGTMASYLVMAPVLGMGIINFIAMLVVGAVIMHWITSYKKGRPASWLWDLRLAIRMIPEQRGLLRATAGVRWLSAQHVARPAVFVSGATRAGEDLTISAPWMARLPPLIDLPLVLPPRRRRVWSRTPAVAPPWFAGANGFEKVITPKIPVSCTWTLVPEREPPLAKRVAPSPNGRA
jgi:hypothetical protein